MELTMTRSQFAQTLFSLRGKPLTFERHAFMPAIIDCTRKRVLMKCSRQVGKSTINSIRMAIDAAGAEVHSPRIIFVTPTQTQTKQFSVEKLEPLLWESKDFKKMYLDNHCKRDVFLKSLTNGAMIFLRSAFRTADRIRGIPGDELLADEIQDILPSFLPVMESSLDASDLARVVMTGTPKSTDNHIEEMWNISTQTEPHVPCFRHTPIFWNILQTGLDNIGKNGLICSKCGKPIDARYTMYRDLFPNAPIKGFHVTQLGVAWKQDSEKWKDEIIYKMENWGEDIFHNETLGVSYGHAAKPITLEDMRLASYPNNKHKSVSTEHLYDSPPVTKQNTRYFAGVDWGEGRDVGKIEDGKKKYASFTILTIGTYLADGKFAVVYWKKFKGKEAKSDFVRKFIINKLREWKVEIVGLDWGFGWSMNQDIANAMGMDRVAQIFHSANLKALYKFDEVSGKLIVNRNALITGIIQGIKRKKIMFPSWKYTNDFAKDFTAIRSEYNESLRKITYYHSVAEPDDSLHSLLYAKFMADLAIGIISPELGSGALPFTATQEQYEQEEIRDYEFDQWDDDFY